MVGTFCLQTCFYQNPLFSLIIYPLTFHFCWMCVCVCVCCAEGRKQSTGGVLSSKTGSSNREAPSVKTAQNPQKHQVCPLLAVKHREGEIEVLPGSGSHFTEDRRACENPGGPRAQSFCACRLGWGSDFAFLTGSRIRG